MASGSVLKMCMKLTMDNEGAWGGLLLKRSGGLSSVNGWDVESGCSTSVAVTAH